MNKRLTQPMRLFLQCLVDGKTPTTRTSGTTGDFTHVANSAVGTALRKRGYVTMERDATYRITNQGRQALQAAPKGN